MAFGVWKDPLAYLAVEKLGYVIKTHKQRLYKWNISWVWTLRWFKWFNMFKEIQDSRRFTMTLQQGQFLCKRWKKLVKMIHWITLMTVTFVFARICSGKQKHSKIPSFVGTSPLYIRKRPFEKNRKKTCYSLDILFMCKAWKKLLEEILITCQDAKPISQITWVFLYIYCNCQFKRYI